MMIGGVLLGLAFWVALVGAIVGWPLTLPTVFVLGMLAVAALVPPRRPYDWHRDGV